ncbi:MAG: glycosyltransferase family 4 protein [Rubrivivax sp.]|nr:glycosyltransferase family 4 protein [Rubrivivax sp.]
MTATVGPHPLGINVLGEVSGNLGVGVAARHLVSALLAKGHEVSILDLDAGLGRKGYASNFAHLTVSEAEALPHAVSLFILPPAAIVGEVMRRSDLSGLLMREQATNVALTYWELPALANDAARALEVFDVVVAPSAFVEAALDFSLSGTRIVRGLQPVDLPPQVVADRDRFELPAGAFVAVTSFDPHSDPSRKNPFGALEAFRRAFPQDENVRLVFKVNVPRTGLGDGGPGGALLETMRERIGADPRIVLLAETLSYPEVLSLYASADAFISLHRAEGLGLGLLEAMALGKPVVATGWSGNKSFMHPSDACLVRYRLVPVQATIADYTSVAKAHKLLWAEPDLDDAALWLRRLANSPELRSVIGSRARASVARYREEAAQLRFVDDILAVRAHQLAAGDGGARRRVLAEKIALARRTARRDALGLPGWLADQARAEFDRRIGWRLTGRRRPLGSNQA